MARLREIPAVATANRWAPLLIRNMTLEINSSLEGRLESACMSATPITWPSAMPALKLNTGLSFAHLERIFANVTGSLGERATAVGPENWLLRDSIGVPAAARTASVFFTTR